ncbi:MAG: phosphatidate cytidylyltransferase [Anaerolineae bacterium]|nr:phosphatidate cytidylyltransferase [Anaerolineae bacterium]MCB9106583.1 phosphatidate cytidylyltransferase [Anaerolineales bacterium]
MLRTRIITALIALPIVAAATFAGGVWFFAGATIITLITGWEFCHMMRAKEYDVIYVLLLAFILLLMIDGYYPDLGLLGLSISAVLLSSLVWQLFRTNSSTPTADWALTVTGGLYIGWGMARLVALRQLPDGLTWVWLALIANWSADTMAYLVGRTWGRHKLWPRHSPKKTWEGLAGGVVGGMIGAVVVILIASSLSWITGIIIGAIIAVAGLFGDLSISMMKRHAGVKDSSNLFPGHGGFLDRLDSVLFVSIVVYYFALWIG